MNVEFQPYVSPRVTGEILRARSISSKHLAYPRDVLVWLPPGYHDDPSRRYPVLYLQDGQNKFDPDTAYLGEDWKADESATALIRGNAVEPFIMVAIYNSPDRLHEYNPLRQAGKNYGRFVTEELMPLINQHFRTDGGRRNALMGSSMGGLISLALLWHYPDHFFGVAALSPSLWILWRTGGVVEWLRRFPPPPQPGRVYIDHGTVGYEGRSATLAVQLVNYLKEVGFPPESLAYHIEEGGEHNELSWRARAPRPLRFLFGKHRAGS
jgi:predicted alpha/beta superfamily hydrolase